MTSLTEKLAEARREVEALERQVAAAPCREVGHRWVHVGGRNCGCGDGDGRGRCSVPVFTCSVCQDCDYGENAEAEKTMADCAARLEFPL